MRELELLPIGNLLVARWRSGATRAALEAILKALEAMRASHGSAYYVALHGPELGISEVDRDVAVTDAARVLRASNEMHLVVERGSVTSDLLRTSFRLLVLAARTGRVVTHAEALEKVDAVFVHASLNDALLKLGTRITASHDDVRTALQVNKMLSSQVR